MCKKLIYLISVLVLGLVGVASGTEGLKGEYYHASISAHEWQDLVLTRIDPMVNFDWGTSSPEPGVVNSDNFTVRWTGTIEVPNSETYTFHTQADDGVRLWVNNELIIDTWTWSKTWHVTQPPIEFGSGDITLTAGQQYEIILEHYEHGGNAMCKLSWSTPTLTQEAIPSRYMSPKRPYAHNPDLPDGATLRDMWVSLGWTPGDFAASHDVYFSDNLANVEALVAEASLGNQPSTNFVAGFPGFPYPEGLVPGTTYYWRIVEVNESNPESPWKGPVWSFMIAPKTSYNPNPADGADSVDLNVWLSWEPGLGAMLHHMYFSDSFADVNDGTSGTYQGPMSFSEYTPDTLKLGKTYYWRIDEFDIINTYKGDVWSFTTQGAVESLSPSNGAVDVKQTQILIWSPSVFAASHQLYFGTDEDAVKNADTGSPEYKGARDLAAESYDPGMLEWDTTYYWRVDEVNNANADSPWIGPVWSFTTADFLIVDDFESYNDLDPAEADSNRIFNAWIDGYDDPANGSLVGYDSPPFAEQTIVHSGSQSMPLYYDNSVGYSEATLTLTYPRDWTEKGVTTLTIWFRGDSANAAETLYVALNGNAIVTNDNPNAAQAGEWTEWNIDLQTFGVNLANVNTIALGLGNKNNPLAGGSGTMYFDDIRLYPPPPEPAP